VDKAAPILRENLERLRTFGSVKCSDPLAAFNETEKEKIRAGAGTIASWIARYATIGLVLR
jgi:hypothetical protein